MQYKLLGTEIRLLCAPNNFLSSFLLCNPPRSFYCFLSSQLATLLFLTCSLFLLVWLFRSAFMLWLAMLMNLMMLVLLIEVLLKNIDLTRYDVTCVIWLVMMWRVWFDSLLWCHVCYLTCYDVTCVIWLVVTMSRVSFVCSLWWPSDEPFWC